MDKIFIRNFLIFVVLLLSCVGLFIYYFISGDRALGAIDESVIHTHEIITEAEQLISQIEGMVVAQRGYLLSKDEEFVSEYETRKSTALEGIIALRDLTNDNESQQTRIKKLEETYNKFSETLEARAASFKGEIDLSLIRNVDEIDRLRDSIMQTNKAILDEEYDLLNIRVYSLQSQKTKYLTTLIGGVITGAILLLIFNAFLLRAQRKRALAEEELKDTEDRFALALEGTQDGIYDWNVKEDKIFYSRRFFEMLGYDNKAYIGKVEDSFKLVHPDDVEKLQEAIDKYLSGNLSEFSQEFRLQHKSNRWVWVQSRARGLFGKDGKAYRLVGANTDISHLKHEQERLALEKERAEAANTAKGDFLAHMSHEIRTPLTAISGIAEIFERNLDNLDDKQKKLIKTLNSSASSLKDIINDVLDFSKIEGGDIELEERAFALQKLFAEVISMMSVRANEKGINFVCDDSAIQGADFYGDKIRLRQILVNLIGNALKFTNSAGSVIVKAKFEDRDGEQFLRIDIADTGIGIKSEDFDTIFDRFKQADATVSRKYGGTGLGLTISRNLAQLMGGDIFLSSKSGQGSTFSVLLPMRLEYEGSDQQKLIEANNKSSDKIKSSLKDEKKLLMVEDYDGNVVVISYILDEIGLEFDVAKNGVEAVELWSNNHYDVILMDVQMPEMDGFAATKAIRNEEKSKKLPRTPIIGMTAHALVGDKSKCIEAGMDAYLPKPIVEGDLIKEIYRQIDQKKRAA